MKIYFSNKYHYPITPRFIINIVETFYRVAKISKEKEVSVALIKDSEMRKLNKSYRGKDSTTDVLSFSDIGDDTELPFAEGLGEVLISYSQAFRQAKDRGHSIKKEIEKLLVHGLAHLAGYDHETDREEMEMNKMESKVLKKMKK